MIDIMIDLILFASIPSCWFAGNRMVAGMTPDETSCDNATQPRKESDYGIFIQDGDRVDQG